MKLFAFSALVGTGLIILSSHVPSLLEKQASVLKDAKTLKITYTFQHVGGSRGDYTLTYSKPNLFIVDGPDKFVESDGTTLWEYNKTSKTYTEVDATPEVLAKQAQTDETLGWASFFTDAFVKKVTSAETGGSRAIKGQQVTELNFTLDGTPAKSGTLYIDDKLGIARGFTMKSDSGSILALASDIQIGGDAMTADKFKFVAPEGATKAAAPSADSPNWAMVQPIFASNCSPCHAGNRGKGGFSIRTYESVMKGAEDGPVIVAGDPDNSKLVQLITGQAAPKMPPQGNVSAADVDKIKAWIKAGAKQ
ncbi:MAG TPA: c-type cytochrome domain-containing protein [Fimbriimonadaceae bacterium]|nr:c-type cytochrome domain-containing protein [Fimbriimonadaceae bacterium]